MKRDVQALWCNIPVCCNMASSTGGKNKQAHKELRGQLNYNSQRSPWMQRHIKDKYVEKVQLNCMFAIHL